MSDNYNPVQMLKEWHTKFGVPVVEHPTVPPSNRISLREDLIREEFEEFLEAGANRDIIAAADALADMLYVVYGSAIEWGIPIEEAFREVHRSNMSKIWPDGTVHYREDGKVIKPPTYSPADIEWVLTAAGDRPAVELEDEQYNEAFADAIDSMYGGAL